MSLLFYALSSLGIYHSSDFFNKSLFYNFASLPVYLVTTFFSILCNFLYVAFCKLHNFFQIDQIYRTRKQKHLAFCRWEWIIRETQSLASISKNEDPVGFEPTISRLFGDISSNELSIFELGLFYLLNRIPYGSSGV